MSFRFLRYQLLALALGFSATASAFAQETLYQIPWRNVAAKDCAIVLDQGNGSTVIVIRCKGHIDIAVAQIGVVSK